MIRQTLLRQILPTLRLVLFMLLAGMLVVVASCGDDDDELAAEPAQTPAEEPEPPFEPLQVFQLDIDEQDTLHSAAYAPDGDMVATGGYLEVHLLDPEDGSTIRVIEANHSVEDLQFSPDGSLIGAGQGLYGVMLSNVDDGSEHLTLHSGYNNVLAFSPDEETIATSNRDGVLWIWDVQTGEELSEFVPPETEFATSVVFAPAGATVALGNWDGDIFLWDVESGELVATLENPADHGYADRIAFAPDGEHLAVVGARADFDDVVRLWNVDEGSEHGTILFENQTRAVAYAPDGSQLAAAGGATIKIVDPDGLDVIHEIELDVDPEESSWITDLAYSPDGSMLFVSRWDGTVEMWQVRE